MKVTRFVLLALFVAAASLVLAGCGKVYTFDFDTAKESELALWRVDGQYGGTVSYADGALLDGYCGIASPVSFDGDWTMSVVFDLSVDNYGNEVYFEIYPGDIQGWEPDNYIWSYFDCVGREGDEAWYVDDTGTSFDVIVDRTDHISLTPTTADDTGTIPSLNRSGRNTWKIVKTGNNFKTYMNNALISQFNAVWCDTAEDFYLNIYADLTDLGEIIFRSVKVEYKGNMFYTF